VPKIPGIPGPYWFFFYSFDCNEPMHVHVRRDRQQAKFWLAPVALAWNHGFSALGGHPKPAINRHRKTGH
jgi:hypothetical protein